MSASNSCAVAIQVNSLVTGKCFVKRRHKKIVSRVARAVSTLLLLIDHINGEFIHGQSIAGQVNFTDKKGKNKKWRTTDSFGVDMSVSSIRRSRRAPVRDYLTKVVEFVHTLLMIGKSCSKKRRWRWWEGKIDRLAYFSTRKAADSPQSPRQPCGSRRSKLSFCRTSLSQIFIASICIKRTTLFCGCFSHIKNLEMVDFTPPNFRSCFPEDFSPAI